MSGPYGEYDYYAVLGVEPGASEEQIRQAYRELVFVLPPARVPPEYEGARLRAEAQLKRVNEAYEVLSDPTRRAKYDRENGSSSPHPAAPQSGHGDKSRRSLRVAMALTRFLSTVGQHLFILAITLAVITAVVVVVVTFTTMLFLLLAIIFLTLMTGAIFGK